MFTGQWHIVKILHFIVHTISGFQLSFNMGWPDAYELLAAAAQRDLPVLDEKLYLDVFAPTPKSTQRRVAQGK